MSIAINDTSINRGEKKKGNIEVGSFFDGTKISIPFFVINGRLPGKVLLVTSGHSGLSFSAIEAARRLSNLNPEDISGTIIIAPIINVPGFITKTENYSDILSAFPGKENGNLVQRSAHLITKHLISKSELYIHLTNTPLGTARANQVVIYPCSDDLLEKEIELATSFGTPFISDSHNKLTSRLDGRPMTIACSMGIPGIMPNFGEGGYVNNFTINDLYNGVINVLKHYKMKSGKPYKPEGYSSWDRHVLPISTSGGFIRLLVNLGDFVKKGQLIAEITDEFNILKEKIISPEDGLITIVPTCPTVNFGEPSGLRVSLTYCNNVNQKQLYDLSKERPPAP
jgi:predicted deacylase